MKTIFRDILLEREFAAPIHYHRREQTFPSLPQKALAVLGIRRAGKTTFLRQIWDNLLKEEAVPPERLVYVNFFDERLFDLRGRDLGQILEAYYEIHGEVKAGERLCIFLDEVAGIPGWELFVDRLLRARHRVYLSGSSAKLLSRETASALRGRALGVEIFPFSFRETLLADGQKVSQLAPRDRAIALRRFKDYLREGGFPETLKAAPFLRRRLLQDYVDAVILRDVIERHNPSDPLAVKHLCHLLMNQAGSFVTLNKTVGRLQAQGLKVNKPEISQFMEWLQDSYLFFTVPILTPSAHARLVNPRKIYCVDPGMVHHQGTPLSDSRGHLLENAVFNHLRRETQAISYFRDRRQREVDFVVERERGRCELIQVAWSLRDPETRRRELEALDSAMAEMSLPTATLLTMEEEEDIRRSGKLVRVRPAWAYLLNLK